jgi:hypothetical protein
MEAEHRTLLERPATHSSKEQRVIALFRRKKKRTCKPSAARALSLQEAKLHLCQTIEREREAGIPLTRIMASLDVMRDLTFEQAGYTLEESPDTIDLSPGPFDVGVNLRQTQMEWARFINDEKWKLHQIMVDRNKEGRRFEREGKIVEAIALYEANLYDGFDQNIPYDRLRVIYTRQCRYDDAIRVCRAYLDLPDRAEVRDKDHFRHHLIKLQEQTTRSNVTEQE